MTDDEIRKAILDIMTNSWDDYFKKGKSFPREKVRHQVIIETRKLLKDEDQEVRHYYLNLVNECFQLDGKGVYYGRYH